MQPSGSDPRLSYCLHVPAAATTRPEGTRLVIVVHGSERRATAYRDAMVDFAEAQNCVVLAPLFPVGPFGDGHGDGYKYLVERDLRYDLALLDMVAETELRLGFASKGSGCSAFRAAVISFTVSSTSMPAGYPRHLPAESPNAAQPRRSWQPLKRSWRIRNSGRGTWAAMRTRKNAVSQLPMP